MYFAIFTPFACASAWHTLCCLFAFSINDIATILFKQIARFEIYNVVPQTRSLSKCHTMFTLIYINKIKLVHKKAVASKVQSVGFQSPTIAAENT